MKVTVTEKGEVTIWEEMVMKRQAIKQTLGFSEKEKRHE